MPDKIKDISKKSFSDEMPVSDMVGSQKHLRRIGVSISKGGLAKTTTAVNLSMGLAMAGFKVLLVDTDTQGHASYMLGTKDNEGVAGLLTGTVPPDEAPVQARDNLWVLSGGKSLAGVRREIERQTFGAEMTLADKLSQIEQKFDYIIADTPPGWDVMTVNVLFYASEVLAPVSLEALSIHSLADFYKSVAAIQKFRPEISLKFIVPTFFDKKIKESMEILGKLNKLYGSNVCGPIRYDKGLAESPSHGKTIFEFSPGSAGAEDYRALVRRVAGDDSLFM